MPEVLAGLETSMGLEHARRGAWAYANDALEAIAIIPDSPASTALRLPHYPTDWDR